MITREKIDFDTATGGLIEVANDWMPATGVRSIILDDPCLLWLDFHGKAHGFTKDDPDYSFLTFIAEVARGFENQWVYEMALPGAVQVCEQPWQVRSAESVAQTIDLMEHRVPVIYQGAIWWAPERSDGTPDLLVLRSWLAEKLPELGVNMDGPDHYVVLDCKFTRYLHEFTKVKDLAVASAQVRIYSYIVGQMQKYMPSQAYLITRDRLLDPIPVDIQSSLKLRWTTI